jgi:SsrA-binding protein
VDSFAQEKEGEIFPVRTAYSRVRPGHLDQPRARRTRKLLLHRDEINRLIGKTRESGLTLVPLSLYFADGWAKVEIGLARGRKSYDKRDALAKRDADREISREMGRRNKGMA